MVQSSCPRCGSPVAGTAFCTRCGADLRQAPAPQAVPAPAPRPAPQAVPAPAPRPAPQAAPTPAAPAAVQQPAPAAPRVGFRKGIGCTAVIVTLLVTVVIVAIPALWAIPRAGAIGASTRVLAALLSGQTQVTEELLDDALTDGASTDEIRAAILSTAHLLNRTGQRPMTVAESSLAFGQNGRLVLRSRGEEPIESDVTATYSWSASLEEWGTAHVATRLAGTGTNPSAFVEMQLVLERGTWMVTSLTVDGYDAFALLEGEQRDE